MARSNAIPVYSAGTVAVAQSGGVWGATGTNTKWSSPDNSTDWTIAVGDWLVCATGFGPISAINSDASLALFGWAGAAAPASTTYTILRYGYASPSSAILGLLQQLKTLGTADNPLAGLAALVGSFAKLVFDQDSSGTKLALKIRSAGNGVADSALVPAMTIDPTSGAVAFPSGVAIPDAVGFRNRICNAQFTINQCGVSGTVTLAAGAYGHDGVKAGSAGAVYTFTQSGVDVALSISSGSLILPVEAAMIEGGTFVLSHDGTAPVRIWQGTGNAGTGSYAAGPITASLAANTQTNVEFSAGTVLRPQLEPGATPTKFERRPSGIELAMCQRYYESAVHSNHYIGSDAARGGYVAYTVSFKTPKRPGVVVVSIFADGVGGRIRINDAPSYSTNFGVGQDDPMNQFDVISIGDISSRTMIGFGWNASARL